MTLRSVVATRGLSSSSVGRLASSPTIFNQHNNRDEIDKLNELIKVKLAQLEEDEKRRIIEESKPKLSDFQRPILLTLVIASTAYLAFHWAWWYLEYDEREKELKAQVKEKSDKLQKLLAETGQTDEEGNKVVKKRSWWRFWAR
ncbi:Inner membrane assembly complex subunit 17 [Cyberlindnera fabianii]|uniref:Inner membrane assembly complex subunit 17 n=1 Tax=Cyberlindnera fabianii TaxID=36022 RepID=A0A1V2L7P2_CYBFA|nr:Inner membrane assembly complex subunit 17 [Cyberlindnera fabianii]